MASSDKKQPTTATPAATGGVPVGVTGGGELTPVGGAPPPAFRSGGVTLDVGVDVTNELDAAVPAFGSVLTAIGNGVAQSQTALDQGVIDMVNELSGTNIKVVTDVVQVLNDDGLPDASATQLVTQEVSVLNYFTPTIHEWKHVAVAMDLTVGSFHAHQGLQFNQHQAAASDNNTGLFWGFLGWTDFSTSSRDTSVSSEATQEVAWQSGQVRVDALLGPRRTGKLPVPANVSIGPQIYVSQGAVVEQQNGGVVTARTVSLQVEVRKADGSPNPGKNIVLTAGGLLPSFTNGSATDANGRVQVTLTRSLFAGFTAPVGFSVTVMLGNLRKGVTVTL